MTKAKRRKTPWDPRPYQGAARPVPLVRDDCEPLGREASEGVICLRGLWVFDPVVCTSRDTRHFFWAGLQLLNAKAKLLGLADDEVRRLMMDSFNVFHDAANGLWGALQQMMSSGGLSVAAVEAHCQFAGAMLLPGRAMVAVPQGVSEIAPLAHGPCAGQVTLVSTPVTGQAEDAVPLLASEGPDMNSDAEEYPAATPSEPVDFGWTPEGYEVRAALKRYSESTYADR